MKTSTGAVYGNSIGSSWHGMTRRGCNFPCQSQVNSQADGKVRGVLPLRKKKRRS